MLTAFTRAFRTPDLRKKLLFTLGIIALFRLGSVLPTPGVHTENIALCLKDAQAGSSSNIYGMVQLFSGGALLKLSVFALGIMPYITASIILQLLVVVIPRLEALKKEGQAASRRSRSTPVTSRSAWRSSSRPPSSPWRAAGSSSPDVSRTSCWTRTTSSPSSRWC
nr:hypothetical protein GCM10020093_087660 [Planobispora longispora]